MDRFAQLRTFVRVADLGSFSRAAVDLERSRALIRQQVAALERRRGARPPGYLASAGLPRPSEELRGHGCIGGLSSRNGRLREGVFRRGRSRLRFRPACALAFNLPEGVISAGIADGGILQAVDLLVGGAVAAARLRPVMPENAAVEPPISVARTQASRYSAKVRVFTDFAARLLRHWSQRLRARAGA